MNRTIRTALVTGAASGIGAAIAARLARDGYDVILLDRDPAVAEVASGVGGRAVVADVTDRAAVAAAVGGLDALDAVAAVAGIATATRIDDGDTERTAVTLDVNLVATIDLLRACVPILTVSSAPRIVAVGSVQGAAAAADSMAYGISKAGVHALVRSLAVDLAPAGVLVNALAPGFIDTPMSLLADGRPEFATDWFRTVYVEHGRIPLRRPGTPEEVAAAAAFLLSPENGYITGAVLPVDGGLTATF